MIEVKFKKLHPEAQIPTKHLEAACFDLYSIEYVRIEPGRSRIIRTGIALEIPQGYAGFLHTRSGMGFKGGFRVHMGVFDPDFRGELTIRIFSRPECNSLIVAEGDRIAQIFFCPITPVELVEVEELTDTERGEKGMGSSGK